MKWTIVGLIVVGVVAALAAAMLTATLRADMPLGRGGQDDAPYEMEILVAARDLPSMSVVEGSSLVTKKAMSNEVPEGVMTTTVQVIGQVLITDLKEGQAFTSDVFASDSARLHLAAALPAGGRAMTIVLKEDSGIEDLLYPGCLVDVVSSFRMPAVRGAPAGEVVSVTLLQGLQVLSVGQDSVVGREGGAEAGPTEIEGKRQHLVTVLVNQEQAEALQLATMHGSITLALRNPLDTENALSRGVLLSDLSEEIAQRLASLTAAPLSSESMTAENVDPLRVLASGETMTTGSTETAGTTGASMVATAGDTWTMVVMRGRAKESIEFAVDPDADTDQEP